MKKNLRKIILSLYAISVVLCLGACSEDEECGDCSTEAITQEISIDNAVLKLYEGRPIIYTQMDFADYSETMYCFICDESMAKDLIKKVQDGGYIRVNVRGIFRELREGEPDLSGFDSATNTRTSSCDIQIKKIKKA